MPKRILIIGAGPVGVEAAVSLLCSTSSAEIDGGLVVHMVESESGAGGGILRKWPHVKLFSPWRMNTSTHGKDLLEMDRKVDPSICPTGEEFCRQYIQPLVDKLKKNYGDRFSIEYNTRVVSISRLGHVSKSTMGSAVRKSYRFCCLCSSSLSTNDDTESYREDFDFVIDASGLTSSLSYCGPGGMPCVNERALLLDGNLMTRDIPTVNIEKFKDKQVAVIGSGYSAATSVKHLLEAQVKDIHWITRKEHNIYDVIDDDLLPERKSLCKRSNELISSPLSNVHHHGGVHVVEINHKKRKRDEGSSLELRVASVLDDKEDGGQKADTNNTTDENRKLEVDYVISNTGLRPDLSIHTELQVHLCYASDGIMKLAASLLGASGDCLAQPAAGIETLISPEPNFYILGSKSYGRNSSFLLRVGIEQVMELTKKIIVDMARC